MIDVLFCYTRCEGISEALNSCFKMKLGFININNLGKKDKYL